MAFNEIKFLFLFFPAVLLLHAIMPYKAKNILLLIASLVFFAWGTPEYLFLMILIILYNYFSALQLGACKKQGKVNAARSVLATSVAVNLVLLGFFKYWGFLLENINAVFGLSIPARELPMPVGVSFFTFSILSYLFDVYRDRAPETKNILDFSLFVTFFPKLVSGPIVQYADMEKQLHHRIVSTAKFGLGARLFIIGLAKKVLLSNTLGTTFYAVSAASPNEISTLSAWIGTISYTLMLYFDFSGYSDMAIGLSYMFGFSFEKNFDYPYMSASITDFWRRWHISLGAWFRDYVYIPMGGSRGGTARTIRNLLCVWFLTGIWHGANWTFLMWGLYYGVLLIFEKFIFKNAIPKIPVPVRRALTLLLVMIGWVFFFSPDLGSAVLWLGHMFGLGSVTFADSFALYHLVSGGFVILIGIIAATPFGARIGGMVYHGRKVSVCLSIIWFAMLLLCCIAGMLSGTYTSFLYFQF